jgi:4-aminobutyrate aminotransferase-like enzyme
MTAGPSRRGADIIARRRALLGSGYRHFYSDPVEIVRGEGVRVFDAEGNEFLDAYNNVPCVGHSNPRVVAAIAEQAARLNTHTRYLSTPILDYAERLLASLGGDLGRLMFTCSGSEANDLALRVARLVTGHAGVVVTANAYHGVTAAVAEISPSLGAAVAPGPTVRTITLPKPGAVDPEAVGSLMAGQLDAAVAELQADGHGFAALFVDTIFSSDGILPGRAGFLRPLAAAVARHGGLFVADEVQAGFARTGATMWGFQRHGVDPDLVTMGKPMGNGMPIAALAGRPDLLDAFGRATRYFNTFGGSSVPIAAATAVLDEIEEKDLLANAAAVGEILLEGLSVLGGRHDALRNARGAGLFLAADIVPGDGRPIVTATEVVEAMRQRQVLISTTGVQADALKIRPPLTFAAADAAWFLDALDAVLASVGP